MEFLLETLREYDLEAKGGVPLTLIALAPLTNVALLVRLAPELCREKLRVLWMGGAAAIGGNARPWSEANACYDPEAAHIVLSSGLPLTMYTWDAYQQVAFSCSELCALLGVEDEQQLDTLCSAEDSAEEGKGKDGSTSGDGGTSGGGGGGGEAEAKAGSAAAEGATPSGPRPLRPPSWTVACVRLLRREMHHWGTDTVQIGDAGAVCALLAPASGTGVMRPVGVELNGQLTRGMTVVDARGEVAPPDQPMRPANVEVITETDPKMMKALFAQHVLQQRRPADT